MENQTASTVHCLAKSCVDSFTRRASFGVFLLVFSLSGAALVLYVVSLIVRAGLCKQSSVYYVIVSQLLTDVYNLTYHIYRSCVRLTGTFIIFSDKYSAVSVSYYEGFAYNGQVIHHASVAAIRLLYLHRDKLPASVSNALKSGWKVAALIIAITHVSAVLVTISVFEYSSASYYINPEAGGAFSNIDPESFDLAAYNRFYDIFEGSCISAATLMNLALFAKIYRQRNKAAVAPVSTPKDATVDKSNKTSMGQGQEGVKAPSKMKVGQEMNIIYYCVINGIVCFANFVAWRELSTAFDLTDKANSVAAAIVALLFIKEVQIKARQSCGMNPATAPGKSWTSKNRASENENKAGIKRDTTLITIKPA